jgi:drug/metabolite transporter (DMT)-like permease
MTSALLVAAGVLTSAGAQLLIKRAAAHALLSPAWIAWMGASAASYAASFALYSVVLRRFSVSVIGPVMTVAVMCTVVLAGLLMGETLAPRQWAGLALGISAVVVILA